MLYEGQNILGMLAKLRVNFTRTDTSMHIDNDVTHIGQQNLENLRRNYYAPIRRGSPCIT